MIVAAPRKAPNSEAILDTLFPMDGAGAMHQSTVRFDAIDGRIWSVRRRGWAEKQPRSEAPDEGSARR